MKRIITIILILTGVLFSQKSSDIKLEKDEHIIRFYSVVYKIEGNKIDLGENGTIELEKGINAIISINQEFLKDTTGNKISLEKIEYPALFEIEAIVKGQYEIVSHIVKNVKKVLSMKYIGGKEKAEEYVEYLKEIEKQFEK